MDEEQYNKIVGLRIRAERQNKHLTLKELGALVGISESTTQRYEKGQIKSVDINIMKKFADALEIPTERLLGWDESGSPAAPQDAPAPLSSDRRKIARIPVLGRVAAGIPIEAIENIEDYEERYISVLEDPHDYFALRIVGHSMEPRIWDGDVVIARKMPDVDSGSVAVVLVDGEDATVKQIKKSDEGITLIGWNPSVYTPKFYTWAEVEKLPVQILGIVKEVRGKIG